MKRIALVTGCSTGIGKSVALKLVKKGYIVFAGVRRIESIHSLTSEHFIPVQLDVNNPNHIADTVKTIEKRFSRLDLLINNAGYGAMGPVAEVPVTQIQNQFSTNVFAPIALAQAVFPLLRNGDKPQVVNIGSIAGVFSIPFSGVYGASKAALHVLSDVLRMELKPFGIHVMTVYPGGIATSFGDNATEKLEDTLVEGSLYTKVAQAISNRAKLSSDSPTTPDMFADTLIHSLEKRTPSNSTFIGHGSRALRFAKVILPTKFREFILRRSYSLNLLSN